MTTDVVADQRVVVDGDEIVWVGPDGEGPPAEPGKCIKTGEPSAQRVLFDVREHNVHALLGKPLRHGQADAAGTPGDDRRAARKVFHAHSPRMSALR